MLCQGCLIVCVFWLANGCNGSVPTQDASGQSTEEIFGQKWEELGKKANGGWLQDRVATVADLEKTAEELRQLSLHLDGFRTKESADLAQRLIVEAGLLEEAKSWADLQFPAIIVELKRMYDAAVAENHFDYNDAHGRADILIASLRKNLKDSNVNFSLLQPGWDELVGSIHGGLSDLMLPAVLKGQFAPGLMSLKFLGVGYFFDWDIMLMDMKMKQNH